MKEPIYCPKCGHRATKSGKARHVSGKKIKIKQRYHCTNKVCGYFFVKRRRK